MENSKIKAMILAAGLGKRMMPLTENLPKPMISVSGRSLIDRALDWVAAAGIDEVVVNSFYKAELLDTHLRQRQESVPNSPFIHKIREDILLETGGGIKNALPLLGDRIFLSANSDTICIDGRTPAIHRLMSAWDDQNMDALLLVHPVERAVGYAGAGDFFINHDGIIRRRREGEIAPYVFTGVQLIHPRLFKQSPEGVFSMNVLYNKDVKEDGSLSRIRAIVHDGDWLHVGDPEGLKLAEDWLQKNS